MSLPTQPAKALDVQFAKPPTSVIHISVLLQRLDSGVGTCGRTSLSGLVSGMMRMRVWVQFPYTIFEALWVTKGNVRRS